MCSALSYKSNNGKNEAVKILWVGVIKSPSVWQRSLVIQDVRWPGRGQQPPRRSLGRPSSSLFVQENGVWIFPWRAVHNSNICEQELLFYYYQIPHREKLLENVLSVKEIQRLSCGRPAWTVLCQQESLFFETSACFACTSTPLAGRKTRQTGSLSLLGTRGVFCWSPFTCRMAVSALVLWVHGLTHQELSQAEA